MILAMSKSYRIVAYYIIFAFTFHQVLSLQLPNEALVPPQCGVSKIPHGNDGDDGSLIVGGKPAALGGWPWLALLGYGKVENHNIKFRCGGALVASKTVVTVAHCVNEEYYLAVVRVGEYNLDVDNDGATPRDYIITTKTMHPYFNPDNLENDIAILNLAESVEFTDAIHPICLPITDDLKKSNFVGESPFVAGWGSTKYEGPTSPIPLEVQIPIVDQVTCKNDYNNSKDVFVDDRLLCAGFPQGGKDACQGDSGGPMMLAANNSWYLIGVVSGGYECAKPNKPGTYTRITAFLDFVLKHLV